MSSFLLLLLCSLIGFVQKRQAARNCTSVKVSISNESDNFFIGKDEVLNLISKNNTNRIEGINNSNISLKALELRIKSHKFVKDAEVHQDLAGNLLVEIQQNRPIARVMRSVEDCYIDREGVLLPLSDHYTARVLPVIAEGNFAFTQAFLTTPAAAPYLKLIAFVDSSAFWKEQMTEMHIADDGKVKFVPLIGQHSIEFGLPERIDKKFEKLALFYKEVTTKQGWDKYRRINLEFENQIVCE